MIRALADDVLLFLAPFALFAIYLLLLKKQVLSIDSWRKPTPWLLLVGIGLVAASLIYAGFSAPRSRGTYVPPHMEDGRLVPGYFK